MKKLNENINRIKDLMDLSEDSDFTKYFDQKYTGQLGPHDESDMAPDGMDDDSNTNEEISELELSEEGESTSSSAYPTVTKWESGVTRGRANPIDFKKKWESGIKKGRGNTLL